jgi:hypothetical protein
MSLVLVAGLLWAREYLLRPNLVLVALSHAVLGSALVILAGIPTRIGLFYFHPDKYLIRTLLPWWKDLANGLW